MSENQHIEPATPVAKKPSGFQPGHARFSGRKKATARHARQLLADMNLNPLEWLANLLRSDTYKQSVIGPDGKKSKIDVVVPLDVRVDAAKTLCGYCFPKLSASRQEISGPDEGPVPVLDVMAIIQAGDGSLARELQEAALEYGGANEPAALPARIVPEDHAR